MTQEQKPESAEFRTREAQVSDLAFEISDWKSYDDNEDIPLARAHLIEAEARGAAEQRRKDAEEAEPVGYLTESALESLRAGGFEGANLRAKAGNAEFVRSWGPDIPVYTHPANVAALEARVKELEEWLQYLTGMGSNDSSLGPRIIDLCFTAFIRRAAGKNEDGGSCDWFNDTRPHIAKQIECIRAAAMREGGEHG